jgi:CDP-paratose 2-epimerase
MSMVVVSGASGLIGSEAVRSFAAMGMDVVGIDNDMRATFFGPDASTQWVREQLLREVPGYRHADIDIRDDARVDALFKRHGKAVSLVVHAAAQPSHDWAARDPRTDFSVNATGTLVLLEAVRAHCPDAVFIFTSTNKVYGDRPNRLPLRELETRFEIEETHRYKGGIDETMSVDATLHSLFGASKVAADVLVQEYGRYFGMKTGVFRGGCLTGPSHSGAELHGFLAYLMKCVVTGQLYRVFGYGGKQVRDNIHSHDLVRAFQSFFSNPRSGEVYNIGGGRASNCSMLEAIEQCETIAGRELQWEYVPQERRGDHMWWISSLRKFEEHYPEWRLRHDVDSILREIHEANAERWLATVKP